MKCPICKKSDEVVTRPDGTKYCLDCGERVASSPSDATACSVSSARREVIGKKLLVAFSNEVTVAILATEIDLILFIKAMAFYDTPQSHEMAKDLLQLKQAAFPQNSK